MRRRVDISLNTTMKIFTVVTTIFFAADVNRRVVRDEPEDARIWLEIRLSFCGAAFAYLHCRHYHLFQTQEMVLMYTENGHL